MDKIKTVLNPEAPWPYNKPKAPEPPKVKLAPKAPKPPSKIKNTDERYKLWAEKNL